MASAARITSKLEIVRKEIDAAHNMLLAIMNGEAVQQYNTAVLGARRYEVTLEGLRKLIKELEAEEEALENKLDGTGKIQRNKTVPDYW